MVRYKLSRLSGKAFDQVKARHPDMSETGRDVFLLPQDIFGHLDLVFVERHRSEIAMEEYDACFVKETDSFED